MKVLIIGGMGLIGGAITEAAVKAGIDVTVLSRRAPFGNWEAISARYIQGDWKDDELARKVVNGGYDVIVDTQIFNETQLERSTEIVNDHCKQFIYISTDSVYARPNENLNENQDIRLEDIKWDYGINKRKAELYLLAHSAEYSFSWTVIRPTLTFGDTRIPVGFSSKRGTYTLIERIENSRPIIRFDDGKSRHSLCHVSIFGNAAVGLFLNEKSYGRFYHISDDYSYTYDEIFDAIESIVGKKGIYVFMDAEKAKKYNSYVYEEMIYDKNPVFTLDNSNIKAVCPGICFHIDIEDVMRETIGELREHRKEVGEDSDYNMLTDILLLKNKGVIRTQRSEPEVTSYLEHLTDGYRREVKKYGAKAIRTNAIRSIKKTISPIKHMIIRK